MANGRNTDLQYRQTSVLERTTTPYDDVTVVDRRNEIDLSSEYPLSERNDIITDGRVTHEPTESQYKLEVEASGDETTVLETVERLRVVPGYAAEGGFALRVPEAPTGNQDVRFGLFEPDGGGSYFGYDSTGVYIETVRDGTRQGKVYSDDWNGETPPRPPETLLERGNIVRVKPFLYNHGAVEFEMLDTDEDNVLSSHTVHRQAFPNQSTWSTQNNPIRIEIANNGTAEPLDVFVTDRQASIRGDFTAKDRLKGERRGSVSVSDTAWTPIMSFRRKDDFQGIGIELFSFSTLPNDDILIQVRSDALSNPDNLDWQTPQNIDADETAVETVRSGQDGAHASEASIDAGYWRFQLPVVGGQGSRLGLGAVDGIDPGLRRDRPLTVFARRRASGSTEIAHTAVTWREQW